MAIAPYTLRLSPPPPPPPPLDAPLFPHLRPYLRRRGSAKVAAAGTSWAPVAAGESDDGFRGWSLPERERPLEQGRRKTGFGRAVAVGLGASAAIALAGLAWQFPSSRNCLQRLIAAPLHYVQEKLSTLESTDAPKEDATDNEHEEDEALSPHETGVAVAVAQAKELVLEAEALEVVPWDAGSLGESGIVLSKLSNSLETSTSGSPSCQENSVFLPESYISRFDLVNWKVLVEHPRALGMDQKMLNQNVRILDLHACPDVSPSMLIELMAGENSIVSRCVPSRRIRHQARRALPLAFVHIRPGKLCPAAAICLKPVEIHLATIRIRPGELYHVTIVHIRPDEASSTAPPPSTSVRGSSAPITVHIRPSKLYHCRQFTSDHCFECATEEGNTRRLQPHKHVTNAQAAAALTSGRMEEAIRDELNRLEAENQAHLSAMAEIMEELISRGDIQQQWEEKMKTEQQRVFEVDKDLQHVLHELANERTDRENELEDLLKEKAALDRRNQELINLRSEVDGMYDRLAAENAEVMADQQNLENLSSDMTSKHQAVSEAKSYLEAEKEALTMLRKHA
nr:unnamed protein product [Digitaria exilis]